MSLYKRPRSPFYWSKLHHEGKVIRFSTHERHQTKALKVERERAEALDRTKHSDGYYPIFDLQEEFLDWKRSDGRAFSTVSKIEEHLGNLVGYFTPERDIRTLEEVHLESYKTARMKQPHGVSPSTVCKELSTLRQMLKWAHDVKKILPRLPVVKNPKLPKYDPAPKWRLLTPKEIQALLGTLASFRKGNGQEALPYFLFMANTGMRGGELFSLTWEMLDRDRTMLHLPSSITKNRRGRQVPLNDQVRVALDLLEGMRGETKGRLFSARSHYHSWYSACRKSGVGRVRPHDLRHTFGSLLHAAGRSGPEIRDILGHTTLDMANHYAHTYLPALQKAVELVQISVPASVPKKGQNGSKTGTLGQNGLEGKTEENLDKSSV